MDSAKVELNSQRGRKWLNKMCDVQSMWCHIHNGNDLFVTTDRNFRKKSKLPKLVKLGAGCIVHPNDL